MKVQALTSFVGEVVMANGEVKDVDDTTGKDLINAGYAISAESKKEEPKKTAPKKGSGK